MRLAAVLGNKWPAEYNGEGYIPDDSSTMERLRAEKLAFPIPITRYVVQMFEAGWGGAGFWKRSLLEASSRHFF